VTISHSQINSPGVSPWLQVAQTVIEAVVAVRRAWNDFGSRGAGRIQTKLAAGHIHRFFGHQTAGGQLATDNRHQPADAIAPA
jgi:hypothetical protein